MPAAPAPASTLDSLLAGRYVIERELGRGGMGAVHLARDTRLDRRVAIKELPSEYAVVPALRERFLRESRLAAGFSHPNIVPVYAVEESDDALAYVMALIEGETLAERVRRAGPLAPREALRIVQDVAYALAFAHGRNVVHRDIKPDNIMIERATGRALVMDFGVARPIAAPAAQSEGLTRVGEVVGTPEYMSPEQATGDYVDGRSDLYALGLVAHFALTGKVVMTGDSTGRILARQITERVAPMRSIRSDIPAALGDAIDRCLAKDPAERFPDAASLIATLDAAQLAEPEIPVVIRLFAQGLGTLSLVIVGGLLFGIMTMGNVGDSIDSALPLVLLLGVLGTRLLQLMNDARDLARRGFSADAINRGLRLVVAERSARRAELLADEHVRQTRRRAVVVGVVLVAASPLLFRVALMFRVQTGPKSYHTGPLGLLLILAAVIGFSAGAVTLIRSPFRMPIGERLFRLIWIGPIGQWLVARAGRGIVVQSSGATTPVKTLTPPPVKAPSEAIMPGYRISDLEQRVAALERWKSELPR